MIHIRDCNVFVLVYGFLGRKTAKNQLLMYVRTRELCVSYIL